MFAVPVANLIFPNKIFALYSLIILFGVFMTISTYIGIDSITKVSYLAVIVILLFGFIYNSFPAPLQFIHFIRASSPA